MEGLSKSNLISLISTRLAERNLSCSFLSELKKRSDIVDIDSILKAIEDKDPLDNKELILDEIYTIISENNLKIINELKDSNLFLPYEIIEELKSKNLHPFISSSESSCNEIVLIIYENQKYKTLIREWGSIQGIHLNAMDRKSFTNDRGNKVLTCSMHDLQPISGFKWKHPWKVFIDEATTDAEGYSYARGWNSLNSVSGKLYNKSMPFTYVRRKKWIRSMVIDFDSSKNKLPYELSMRVLVNPNQNFNTNNISISSLTAEYYIENELYKEFTVAGPSWTKEILFPFTYLDLSRSFKIVVTKHYKLGSSSKNSLELKLGEISLDTLQSFILHTEKSFTIITDWKITNIPLFSIGQISMITEGQLKEVKLSEHHFKDQLNNKLLAFSLGLGSDCTGLFKELTNLIVNGLDYIEDYDILDVMNDLSQLLMNESSKTEYSTIIHLLNNQKVTTIPYPYSPFFFKNKFIPLQLSGYSEYRPNTKILENIIGARREHSLYFLNQPQCLNSFSKLSHSYFHNNILINNTLQNSYFVQLYIYEEKELYYTLYFYSFIDYIHCLKFLSMIKYATSGIYSNINELSFDFLTVPCLISSSLSKKNEDGYIFFDFEEECIQLGIETERKDDEVQDLNDEIDDQNYKKKNSTSSSIYLPIHLPFKYLAACSVSHSHSLSIDKILEIDLKSIKANFLSNPLSYQFKFELATSFGYTCEIPFTFKQVSMGDITVVESQIDKKIRILLPSYLTNYYETTLTPENSLSRHASSLVDSFISIKLSYDSNNIVNFASLNNNTSSSSQSKKSEQTTNNSSSMRSFSRVEPSRNSSRLFSRTSSFKSGDSSTNLSIQEESTTLPSPLKNVSQHVCFGHSPLDISNVLSSNKAESTLSIEDTEFSIYLEIFKIEWFTEVYLNGLNSLNDNNYLNRFRLQKDMTLTLTLLNNAGEVLAASNVEKDKDSSNSSSSSLFKRKSSSKDSDKSNDKKTKKSEFVYPIQEKITDLHNTSFDFEFNSLDIPSLKQAFFIHIELSNPATSIAECVIPLTFVESDRYSSSSYSILKSNSSTIEKSPYHLGNIMANVSYKTLEPLKDAVIPKSIISMNLSVKPIFYEDCSWPCQIISDKTIEPLVFQLSISQTEVKITQSDLYDPSLAPGRLSMLESCAERISAPGKSLILLVPFSQIDLNDSYILTDSSLYITLKLFRLMPSLNGTFVKRETQMSFLVGPCLSEKLFSILVNKVNLQPLRSHLHFHFTNSKNPSYENEDSFNTLAKMFQDSVYEASCMLDMAVEKERKITQDIKNLPSLNLTIKDSDSEKENEENEDSEHEKDLTSDQISLEKNWTNLLSSNTGTSITLRILYLKYTTLQMYLWFLIESATNIDFKTPISDDNLDLLNETSSQFGDVDTLISNVLDIMKKLEQQVRYQIFQVFKTDADISMNITKIVYDKFTLVTSLLLDTIEFSNKYIASEIYDKENNKDCNIFTFNKRTRYIISNPQKKRDLIKFIITNDNIFINYLNPILNTHRYKFNNPPLLSSCINFDSLIETFGEILDANILTWSTRTLKHFMSKSKTTVDNNSSSNNLPWNITNVYDKKFKKELIISSIPETIQMYLNVEIGLKKISIHKSHAYTPSNTAYRTDSFNNDSKYIVPDELYQEGVRRLNLINNKIGQAIIRSYLSLAGEYERTIIYISNLIHLNKYKDIENEKDDVILFFCSIINDCYRISKNHVPQSINLFSESNSDSLNESLSNPISHPTSTSPSSNSSTSLTFSTCLRVLSTISLKSINELTNQLFFESELRSYFLYGFDDPYLKFHKKYEKIKYNVLQSNDFKNYQSQSFLEETSRDYKDIEKDNKDCHSALDIVIATASDMLFFVSNHLISSDLEKLFYLIIKKIIIRIMILMNDISNFENSPYILNNIKGSNKERENAKENSNNGVDPESPFFLLKLKFVSYLKSISNFYFTLREQLFVIESDATSNNNKISEETPNQRIYGKNSRYEKSTFYLLKYLMQCIILFIYHPKKWNSKEMIVNFLNKMFAINLPNEVNSIPSNPQNYLSGHRDIIKYYSDILEFFRTDPSFIHFIPPDIVFPISYESQFEFLTSPTSSSVLLKELKTPVCTLQIFNIACVNKYRYRNLYFKFKINDKHAISSYRQNDINNIFSSSSSSGFNNNTPQWSDIITFEDIEVLSCKTLRIELFSYKLRALRMLREKYIGYLTIDLVDLLQSEMNNEIEGGDKDKKISPNSKSFTHTGWYTITIATLLSSKRTPLVHNVSHTLTQPDSLALSESNQGEGDNGKSGEVQGISNLFAVSSKAPVDDPHLIQVRLSINFNIKYPTQT